MPKWYGLSQASVCHYNPSAAVLTNQEHDVTISRLSIIIKGPFEGNPTATYERALLVTLPSEGITLEQKELQRNALVDQVENIVDRPEQIGTFLPNPRLEKWHFGYALVLTGDELVLELSADDDSDLLSAAADLHDALNIALIRLHYMVGAYDVAPPRT